MTRSEAPAVFAALLIRWRGRNVDDSAILGRYLVGAGAIRFGIEFVRINAPVLGPLTLAQLWSCAVAIVGVTLS